MGESFVIGCFQGNDARQLLAASPMLTEDILELLNPSWHLSHPKRGVVIFMRKGSAQIGKQYLWHTENVHAFLPRPNFMRINDTIRLPHSETVKDMDPDQIDFADQSVQGRIVCPANATQTRICRLRRGLAFFAGLARGAC